MRRRETHFLQTRGSVGWKLPVFSVMKSIDLSSCGAQAASSPLLSRRGGSATPARGLQPHIWQRVSLKGPSEMKHWR
ncbi:hypothetical protein EYF80_048132 [Liparis tanakae]|uniref:Uncharacterized protein n=1 Tax=Liparis tanakae TaxID=230148 RepID=A0A4Z2FKM1_9TELE|nr:hypothetical protein EYF80_048132 [Liparis tanakae]